MTTWLSFFTGMFQLLTAAFNWAHDRNLIDAGGVAAFAAIMQGQANDLNKKLAVMAAARKRFDDAGPDNLPSDIQFRD